MINAWLVMPVWAIFGLLGACFLASGAFFLWLCHGSLVASWIKSANSCQPVFFSSVAVLLALLTGFLASEVWERNGRAGRVVMSERSALIVLSNLAIATPEDMTAVYKEMKAYISAVATDEWRLMQQQRSSHRADTALSNMTRLLAEPHVAKNAGGAVQAAMLDAVLEVRKARHDRLSMSNTNSDSLKWASVLMLLLLSQAALALIHMHSARSAVVSTSIYTLAAVVALGFVAIRERPFIGTHGLSAEPIRQVNDLIEQARRAQPDWVPTSEDLQADDPAFGGQGMPPQTPGKG